MLGIAAFLGKLFGSAAAGDKIIDGVVNAADKLWHTDEEKSDDKIQAKREGMSTYLEWLKSTSGSRLARRIIALTVTSPWAVAHFTSTILDAAAPFITGTEIIPTLVNGKIIEVTVLSSTKWSAAADSLASNASENNALVGVILLFYFGGPAAGDAAKGLIEKWVSKGQK